MIVARTPLCTLFLLSFPHAYFDIISRIMKLAAGTLWLCAASLCWAATPEEIEFFEAQIRPLLATHCHSCHSSKAKTSFAGLHLDTAEGVRKGSDSGPVIVAGDPNASRLLQAVQGKLAQPMPPGGRLKEAQIALLGRWIGMGAPWPADAIAATKTTSAAGAFDLEARRREHWAWQPVRPTTPPPLAIVVHPIDRFLQQQWQAKSLQPAERAIWPPLPGVTPATTRLPYASASSTIPVASRPVIP